MIKEIFQEHECPINGSDFDLAGSEICAVGESFKCLDCGQIHVANDRVQTVTVSFADKVKFRKLPKDADEKALWLAELPPAGSK